MDGVVSTAGVRVAFDSSLAWVGELIAEGMAGELRTDEPADASLHVRVERASATFDVDGWEPLTRQAWRRRGDVVIENVCATGFDLHVRTNGEQAEFVYRWRPPTRERVAARVLRSRFHLLARAALLHYPVLWWAGTRGRAPLHASACVADRFTPLVTAPGGVGRTTLVLDLVRAGGLTTGDNLGVGDGSMLWGLVEPIRLEDGTGRRMPHGRREATMVGRVEALAPDAVVVLERGSSERASLQPASVEAATRSLVASTYMAGELRRYWAFAATLAAGTGLGPAHPPVGDVAEAFAANLPCFSLVLGRSHGARLAELLESKEIEAWA